MSIENELSLNLEAVELDTMDASEIVRTYVENYRTQFVNFNSASIKSIVDHHDNEEDADGWDDLCRPRRQEAAELMEKHERILDNLRRLKVNGEVSITELQDKLVDISLPAEHRVEEKDGGHLIIFTGTYIVLSKYLNIIEEKLENPRHTIREVHFIATKKMFIDVILSNKYWKGVTIKLKADCIECPLQHIVWDLSGRDFSDIMPSRATDGTQGHKDGFDGLNGDNGGNGGSVTFVARRFLNLANLSVITNGGNGMAGQSGGNGANGPPGKNGATMSEQELLRIFPNTVYPFANDEGNLKRVVFNIRSDAKFNEFLQGFNSDGVKDGNEKFPIRTMHYTGIMLGKHEFEYGFSQWALGRACYVLVKGQKATKGQPGGNGGDGGFGGKGGIEGSVELYDMDLNKINVHDVKVTAVAGDNGERGDTGTQGSSGYDGEDGKDIGYMKNCTYLDPNPVIYKDNIYKLETGTKGVWCNKWSANRRIVPVTKK